MRAVRFVLSIGAAAAVLSIGVQATAPRTRVEITNLRLNNQGLIVADVALNAPPAPKLGTITGRVRVEFKIAPNRVETVDVNGVAAVNVKRTAVSASPLPCNSTQEVTATIVAPDDIKGAYVKASLSRKCSAAEGTPDLTVVSVTRTDSPGKTDAQYLQSPRETVIKVTVVIKNIASYSMPFNEQGGTPWTVQVTPGTPMQGEYAGTQTVRRALSGNQEHRFDVLPVAIPCGKISQVTVVVDQANVILESNETNNAKSFPIPGNRCQDGGW
jgi:hypothetical protein